MRSGPVGVALWVWVLRDEAENVGPLRVGSSDRQHRPSLHTTKPKNLKIQKTPKYRTSQSQMYIMAIKIVAATKIVA